MNSVVALLFVEFKQEMIQQEPMKKFTHILLLWIRNSMKVYEMMGLIFPSYNWDFIILMIISECNWLGFNVIINPVFNIWK